MKSFGDGSDRVRVRRDGMVVNSVGHIYNPKNNHDEALAEAYDLNKEGFYRVAKNIRDAVKYARTYTPPESSESPFLNEEEDSKSVTKYEQWLKDNPDLGDSWV